MALTSPRRLPFAVLPAALLILWSGAALADETSAARRAAAAREMDRPYTMAQLSAGVFALPGATVCPLDLTQCVKGEASLALGLENFYRYHAYGIGAGIQWATTLRGDAARGAADLDRQHSRRYFTVEGEFRYYGIRTSNWEWWGGATVGGVVVNDSWSTVSDRDPASDIAFVGPRAATLGTEGLAAGLGIGGEWSFASNWSFGTEFRYENWFLPTTRAVSPTGDLASLSGRLDMFHLGLVLAYRIAL
jgi:hypothetical protein